MANYTVKMTLSYDDDDKRNYDFSCDENDLLAVKSKIVAVNTSLAGGTDDGMSDFFLSDNGGNLTKISAAQIISVEETVLDLGGNS